MEKFNNLLEVIRELGWFADIQCRAADFKSIYAEKLHLGIRLAVFEYQA